MEKIVFVSGCYDILHAGHVQFFNEVKAKVGVDCRLVVSFASAEVLWHYKKRRSSIPDEHKRVVLQNLRMIDEVVIGTDLDHPGLDFIHEFRRLKPQFLVVTEDDQFEQEKRRLCEEVGAEYLVLKKTPPLFEAVSSSSIVRWIKAPDESPLRVDFAGGWLDVPRFARQGARVVNCAISPLVSLKEWRYERCAGLGGSGAWALLNGIDGIEAEQDLGVGWQDPAVIRETGVCVWASGESPVLLQKDGGEFLRGHMALYWTGKPHDTPALVDKLRNFDLIEQAGLVAEQAVAARSLPQLAEAVNLSYQAQRQEGMEQLPDFGQLAKKYSGGGWGGYALYLFSSAQQRNQVVEQQQEMLLIEPFVCI